MPLSCVDYETAAPETVEPVVSNDSPTDEVATIAEIVKQIPTAESEISAERPTYKGEEPISTPKQIPPDEETNDEAPPNAVASSGDSKNQLDLVRGRINSQTQDDEDWPALLNQAVTLLETVAVHPALDEHAALKQRLDNVEQILNASGNVR